MNDLLADFEPEKYWWTKKVPFPFWGGDYLLTHIDVENSELGPTSSQTAMLAAMLKREDDFRPEFQVALFDHYQKEIYGFATYYSPEQGEYGKDDITPPIKKPYEIWDLIFGPKVWIKHIADGERDNKIRFVLDFECHWDDEHGLSIEVTDWVITSFHAG